MAISSGLAAQFGYVAESTYGTPVTVTKFPRQSKAAFVRTANRQQGSGIQSGVFGPVASQYVETTNAGTGSLELPVESRTHGLLFKLLMGSATSAQQGGSAAYLHTFTLADPVGLFATMQVGRPTRGGTVVPQTAKGCKVTKAEYSCQVGEFLKASYEVDARDIDNTTALATASYVAANTFHSKQMAVKLGTYGAEAAVNGVRGISLSIDRPMDTEDYTTVGAGLKSEPVINDFTAISGTISADWLAKADFEDRAAVTTGTSLVWEFVGPLIAATYYETLRFTVPGIVFAPSSQSVDGPKELTNDWAFEWKYDGTNMPKVEYISSDTTP